MAYNETLLNEIKRCNELYRAGTPIVSDTEYDAMVERLKRIDPENEWFKHIEPASVTSNRKVKLPVPMKSLNKVKTTSELIAWIKSLGIGNDGYLVITPKFDGLSLLHNESSEAAYSRGGSENEGQDCTAHGKMAGITSSAKRSAYTYGEFVFNTRSWTANFKDKISPETGDKYKSPRNTAAGLLNRDVPSELLKHIDFFRYGIDEESLSKFVSYEDVITYLCVEFNQVPLYAKVKAKHIDEESLLKLYEQWSQQYYIDGLVIYANDLDVWRKVGRQNTTGNPNYAIAYKNPSFTATFTTNVLGVNWAISKSGAFKPVVSIDTVNTGDCEMENPTGYNAKYVFENKIGEGAVINVTRSGGVIPKILEVLSPATSNAMEQMKAKLSQCPYCGNPTRWNESGVELCCTNKDCDGIRLAKIVFFYTTLKAENMGEDTIAKMFNAGFTTLRSMLDITFEELVSIEGFGESIANNILSQNNKIKQGIELPLLMHASDCFSGIGQVKAKQILDKMSNAELQAFANGFCDPGSEKQITEAEWFNKESKTMQSFFLGIRPFYQFVAENSLQIMLPQSAPEPTSNKYADVRVCFTGIRDSALEEEIIAGGGTVCSGVSKKTTHLIVADKSSQSSKTIKAKQFGIPIMTIDEFVR